MDPVRFDRLKKLLREASDLAPPERRDFLDNECRDDPSLRADVVRFLAGDENEERVRPDAPTVDSSHATGVFDDSAAFSRSSPSVAPVDPETSRVGELEDFEIVREVGHGGMGTVYEAVQKSLGRRVALKTLPSSLANNPKFVERFQREARATARVRHPNIVPVHQVGETSGTYYYAMEFVEGPSLDKILAESRRQKISPVADPKYIIETVRRMAELAEGLEEAHRLDLVHRDIKPSNVLVTPDGRFVLTDFGLVQDERQKAITQSGELLGTIAYMSPEQLSQSRVDARADVYSLGVTLYEALTLKAPFDAESFREFQRAVLFDDPVPPRSFNAVIHRDLETIVLHALEKNPHRRYSSAIEFAADLRRFLGREPIVARPQSTLTRLAQRTWRYRWSVGVVAAFLTLATIAAVLYHDRTTRVRIANEAQYEQNVLGALMKLPLGRFGNLEDHEIWPDPVRDATRELARASEAFPARPEAHYFRAVGLQILGDRKAAVIAAKRAVKADSTFVPAKALYEALNEPELPERPDRTTDGGAPDETQDDWARIWVEAHGAMVRRDWDAAVRAYTLLLNHTRGAEREAYTGLRVEAYMTRGHARLNAENYDEAIEDFGAVRAILPEMVEPVLLLATTYLLKGEPELADRRLRELHERTEFPEAVARRASSLFHDHRDHEIGAFWADRMAPGRLRMVRRSDFLRHIGKREQAVEVAREAVLNYPDSPSAHNNLGNCLVSLKRTDEAIDAYRRALELDGSYVWAYNNLAVTALRRGETGEAMGHLWRAIEIEPRFAQAHYNLGNALTRERRLEEACAAYRRAAECNPNYARAYNNLGIALANLGRLDEAEQAFHRAAQIDPSSPRFLNNLGDCLAFQKKHAEAVVAYRRALEKDPEYVQARAGLAHALEKIGDVKGATKTLRSLEIDLEERLEREPGDEAIEKRLATARRDLARLQASPEPDAETVDGEP